MANSIYRIFAAANLHNLLTETNKGKEKSKSLYEGLNIQYIDSTHNVFNAYIIEIAALFPALTPDTIMEAPVVSYRDVIREVKEDAALKQEIKMRQMENMNNK